MKEYLKAVLFSSWGGLLFTGIICGTGLFVGEWLYEEPSPFFLWIPSWWFCFALFVVIFAASCMCCRGKDGARAAKINAVVAFLGSLLTGRYLVELILWRSLSDDPGIQYVTLLPWSLYAFILFGMIFVYSAVVLLIPSRKKR